MTDAITAIMFLAWLACLLLVTRQPEVKPAPKSGTVADMEVDRLTRALRCLSPAGRLRVLDVFCRSCGEERAACPCPMGWAD